MHVYAVSRGFTGILKRRIRFRRTSENVASENVAYENVACPISPQLPYDTGIYYVSRRVVQLQALKAFLYSPLEAFKLWIGTIDTIDTS